MGSRRAQQPQRIPKDYSRASKSRALQEVVQPAAFTLEYGCLRSPRAVVDELAGYVNAVRMNSS